MVVRFQDIGEDVLEHCVREEILDKDNLGERFTNPVLSSGMKLCGHLCVS